MTSEADIITLWPSWMGRAGAMHDMKVLVRSRCAKCGTLLRVELEDVIARRGPAYSLIDQLERCRMVGCAGSTFYLASRTYGREWTRLLRDPELIEDLGAIVPERTSLDLIPAAALSAGPTSGCSPLDV